VVADGTWTLNCSTHIINTSYILPGSVAFFIGFFERGLVSRRKVVPLVVAFAMMGFGCLWLFQIHLSWVLLPPFAAAAFVRAARNEPRRTTRVSARFPVRLLASGSVPPATLLRFGPAAVTVGRNVQFHVLRHGRH